MTLVLALFAALICPSATWLSKRAICCSSLPLRLDLGLLGSLIGEGFLRGGNTFVKRLWFAVHIRPGQVCECFFKLVQSLAGADGNKLLPRFLGVSNATRSAVS